MRELTREELIEEAAKAMRPDLWENVIPDSYGQVRRDQVLAYAEAALAVFEKAQAPTDGEREDMIAWLMRDHGDDLSPLGRDYTDAEIADMLRRPAQTPTDAQIEAGATSLDTHRWKTMGVNTVECECGEVLGDLVEDAALRTFPADEVFRTHLARSVLKAAFTAGQEEQS